MKKVLINLSGAGLLVIALLYLVSGNSGTHTKDAEKGAATVKIVRTDERSGGTGVIISSGAISKVLTNHHVCNVVEHGGFVVVDDGRKFPVLSYQASSIHDLCLISVAANLGVNTTLASAGPSMYDEAVIAGHPSLLPTIITKGHISGQVIGDVSIGVKECTDADLNGPDALLCIFMGGLPIIRSYQMQVVSATIKPGSSGSAVYNSKGELIDLVFAGSGELGYALAVPYEYIVNFLENEIRTLSVQTPSTEKTFSIMDSQSKAIRNCKKMTNPRFKLFCDLLLRSTLYTGE